MTLVSKSRALFVGALFLTSVAGAEPLTTDELRHAARELAHEGDQFLADGSYAEALERFDRAYKLYPAPTINILSGRCLVELGRLAEAAERYERVLRTPLDANSPVAYRSAVKEAGDRLEKLRPRIPTLRIDVAGASEGDPELAVFHAGRQLPKALIGVGRPVDPGVQEVWLEYRGVRGETERVDLPESEHATLTLTVPDVPLPEVAPLARPAAEPAPRPAASPPPPTRTEEPAHATSPWAYVAWSAAGAGALVGTLAGVSALGTKSDLDDVCAPGCPPSRADDIDRYRTLRTVSYVGFAVGIVGAAAGTFFVLTPEPQERPQTASVTPWVGPMSAGVKGQF